MVLRGNAIMAELVTRALSLSFYARRTGRSRAGSLALAKPIFRLGLFTTSVDRERGRYRDGRSCVDIEAVAKAAR